MYLLLPTEERNKNKNKTRESEIKRNKTIIDHITENNNAIFCRGKC